MGGVSPSLGSVYCRPFRFRDLDIDSPHTHFYLTFIFRMTSRPRTTSFVDSQKSANANFAGMKISSKDGSKVMTVIASPGQGPDRSTEVSYTDTKVSRACAQYSVLAYQLIVLWLQVIGNGSFGVVYQAKLCDTGEMVAIKKVLQDKR